MNPGIGRCIAFPSIWGHWVRGLGYTYRFVRHSKRMSHDDAMDTLFPMALVGLY